MSFILFDPIALFDRLQSAGNPFSAMVIIFLNGGWIAFVVAAIVCGWEGYLEYIRNRYGEAMEYVLLAIDIPKNNEQSPKAVEQIFSHLYGIEKFGNLKERYLQGYQQPSISLEIVSIEGYIQFLIRAPRDFRDLVEAAIYAQYPDAEITEVEDYIDLFPKPLELPHPEYDLWGSQLKLAKPDAYPIRTYPFFEHTLSQKFMDPMASILELMSRMGPGEQFWFQMVIAPVNTDWHDKGIAIIRKLTGKKDLKKKNIDFWYFPSQIGKGLSESITASIVPPTSMDEAKKQQQDRELPSMMLHLSPDEREIVESIGMKIAKLGFVTKMRFIYGARKEVMSKTKGVDGFMGALFQFSTQNLNRIIINAKTRTKIDYFFIKSRVLQRKKRILWAYRYRSMKRGRAGFILNTEELASLWHFPVAEVVKAPTVQKVDAKKAQPPMGLPMERLIVREKKYEAPIQKGAAPPNLPTFK
jgi:hypothetical protein